MACRLFTLRLLLTAISASFAGCAHYQLPGNHLFSPEAQGRKYGGFLELGFLNATDLNAAPTVTYPPADVGGAPTATAQKGFLPSLGFDLSLDEKIDVGTRFQPQAPLSFQFKYQLSGLPETRAEKGAFALSAVLSPGFLMGSEGATSTRMFSGDIAFPAGYHLDQRNLIALTPFFSFASVSGVTTSAATSVLNTAASTSSVSASQFGAGLGYQYSLEALSIRSEISYTQGSIGSTQISGLYLGACLGLRL